MDTRSVALGALVRVPAEQRIEAPPWLMTELAALLAERGRQNASSALPDILHALREQICLRNGPLELGRLQRGGGTRLAAVVAAMSAAVHSQLEDSLVDTSLQQLAREGTREERALLSKVPRFLNVVARLLARTLLSRRRGPAVWTPPATRVLEAVAAQAQAGRELGAGWFAERWALLLGCVQLLCVQQATFLAQDSRSLLALYLPAADGSPSDGEWSPVGSLAEARGQVLAALRRHSGPPSTFLGGSLRHNGARWARVLPSGRTITESELSRPRELDPASLPARPLFVLDPEELLRSAAPSWLALSSAQLPDLMRTAQQAGPETLQRFVAAVFAHRSDLSEALKVPPAQAR